jgi:hypothetical protein
VRIRTPGGVGGVTGAILSPRPDFGRTIQIRNNFVLFVKIIMGHGFVALRRLGDFMGVAFNKNVEKKQLYCSFQFPHAAKLR